MNKDELLGTTKAFGGAAEQIVGKVTGDASTKLQGAAHQAEGRAQDIAGQARGKVSDAVDSASGYAKDAYAKGDAAVRQGTKSLKQQTGVDLNTISWPSVLIGVVLGFLVGAIVSRS